MTELNIYQRMLAVTSQLGMVAKNLAVNAGKSSYKATGEADILKAVKPLEDANGIYSYPAERSIVESREIVSQSQYGEKRSLFMRIEVKYRFVNIDNPSEFVEITSYGDGVDTNDKAPGKAMTYADKYALMKAYKIITGDDPDQYASEMAPKISQETADQLKEALNSSNIDLMGVLLDCGVKKLTDITQEQYVALISKYSRSIKIGPTRGEAIKKRLEAIGAVIPKTLEQYGVSDFSELTEEQHRKISAQCLRAESRK